ncbi:alternate signal-mediated exported protein [Marmoricola sp. URHA0025 HA25]
MKKTTKGALAAAAAGTLLVGGAGTLAFWTDATDVSGGTFTSGHLKLTDSTCTSADWTIDTSDAVVDANTRIVPGDTLTKVCTFKINAAGDHIKVNLSTATPDWNAASSSALTDELTVGATFKQGTTVLADGDEVTPNATITATITVDFPGDDATNGSNSLTGLSAVLDGITLTASQSHNA